MVGSLNNRGNNMEIVKFPEANCVYAAAQPQYRPLPAHKTPEGIVISCWKLSSEELLRLVSEDGIIWVTMLTFNKPLQPIRLSVDKPKEIRAAKSEPE